MWEENQSGAERVCVGVMASDLRSPWEKKRDWATTLPLRGPWSPVEDPVGLRLSEEGEGMRRPL
jgi:hypothetical protein